MKNFFPQESHQVNVRGSCFKSQPLKQQPLEKTLSSSSLPPGVKFHPPALQSASNSGAQTELLLHPGARFPLATWVTGGLLCIKGKPFPALQGQI